jgi:hypothetical protein
MDAVTAYIKAKKMGRLVDWIMRYIDEAAIAGKTSVLVDFTNESIRFVELVHLRTVLTELGYTFSVLVNGKETKLTELPDDEYSREQIRVVWDLRRG